MSNNFADILSDANTKSSWQKPKSFVHTVSAAEAGSGIVKIGVVNIPAMQPTDGLIKIVQVTTSARVIKPAFKVWYSTESGVLQIENGTDTFATNDVVNAMTAFYTV